MGRPHTPRRTIGSAVFSNIGYERVPQKAIWKCFWSSVAIPPGFLSHRVCGGCSCLQAAAHGADAFEAWGEGIGVAFGVERSIRDIGDRMARIIDWPRGKTSTDKGWKLSLRSGCAVLHSLVGHGGSSFHRWRAASWRIDCFYYGLPGNRRRAGWRPPWLCRFRQKSEACG